MTISHSTSASPGLIEHLRVLAGYRELLWLWMMREVRVRYKQSVLGAAWAVLQPLALMAIFTAVFSLFVKMPSDGAPYPLFSYTALLVWTLFSTSVSFAVPSLVTNTNLITKIYFPREILPLASIGAACLDFLVASILFVGMLVVYQTPITWALLWVPVVLLVQLTFIVGLVLPVSALNVFYRDIRFVVPLAIQLLLYVSPIIYPLSLVPERLRPLYMLNPEAGIVDALRQSLIYGQAPNLLYLGMATGVSVVLAVAGYAYFKSAEARFADMI